ncbi:MAG TPA: GAF domain-containing protein [Thermodesulfobacteriota bacterium]|nr:GAF domain-containing protein [Deltaproteobacteria bacterium]HNU71592.1 GAF domain-containing protein [Thermodesulfobacteriota bacterium]HOC38532.1 GAF domain-containing protein [Thermodesulfobacteriota bacterium]HQO78053.1 GAF domain-containing protein [Thermodesulfobacteriota bacterium]
MLNEKEKLQEILRIGTEVAEVNDLDLVLEKILTNARIITNCDAGSICIREGNCLRFSHAQNDSLAGSVEPGSNLMYNIFSVPIDSSSVAGYVAESGEIVNIADAYNLSDRAPYRFDREFDEITQYRSRSMLAVPLKVRRGDVVGVLQMINARDDNGAIIPFPDEDVPMITCFANNAAVAVDRAQMTRAIILRMISMAELRDPRETRGHVNRVAGYSVEIYYHWAQAKGIPDYEIDRRRDVLHLAAMLHDVGKVAISDLILRKPGPLSSQEFEQMKQHTVLGARLFGSPRSIFDEAAAEVALNHHEWWDGTGYPGFVDVQTGRPLPGCTLKDGRPRPKRGEEIPIPGRVVALADVYDALSSERSYKEAWSEDQILNTIRQASGRQFDPEIVEVFFSCLDAIHGIRDRDQE